MNTTTSIYTTRIVSLAAWRLCGVDQGSRKIQGSDRTKLVLEVADRMPAHPRVPVAEKRASGAVFDRRENLAGPLGAVRIAPLYRGGN